MGLALQTPQRFTFCRKRFAASIAKPPLRTPCRGSSNFSLTVHPSSIQYCRDLVFQKDYEGYLASLCLPPKLQPVAWGIRGFNIELAQIRELVTQELLGQMRFQFWRDGLEAISKKQHIPNPVLSLLSIGVHEFGISIPRLTKLITAREQNFALQQYMTVSDMENYAEQTASNLCYLHLDLLGVRNLESDHVASHVGKGIGLVTILKGTPHLLRERRFYLPSDLCAKHGLVTEKVFREGPAPELSSVAHEIATVAHQHISAARKCVPEPSKLASKALLPALATSRWLDKLQAVHFNLFDSRLHQKDPWLALQMWWASRKGKF